MKASLSPHPHQHFLSLVFWGFLITAILTGVKGYLIMVLNCIFLVISDVEHLSVQLLATCMSSLKKNLLGSFVYFPNRQFLVVFANELQELLIYFENYPLSDIWFINIFSHSTGCLFIVLMASFPVQKVFNLI